MRRKQIGALYKEPNDPDKTYRVEYRTIVLIHISPLVILP